MRLKSLFNLHQNRFNALSRINADPALHFLKSYGSFAEFLHIGIDSYKKEGHTIVRPQMFAVFLISSPDAKEREILPLKQGDLENLAKALINHDFNSGTHKNMARQLDMAVKNYEACQPLVYERIPYIRMLQAI